MFARRCVHGRNRPQPSATVPICAIAIWPHKIVEQFFIMRDCCTAVLMVSSAEVVLFGGFRRLVASFRVAGVALRDIQTCFVTCRKSFCVAGTIPLRRFQKMYCIFSLQAQHFGRVHRHFSWQAQHFRRVVLRVYCKSHWRGCVKWRQGANSVAGVALGAIC